MKIVNTTSNGMTRVCALGFRLHWQTPRLHSTHRAAPAGDARLSAMPAITVTKNGLRTI